MQDYNRSFALFTTAYPEGEKYLVDFFTSLNNQTDKNFDLWVGLDRFPKDSLQSYLSEELFVTYVKRESGESNISMRQRALEGMIQHYQAIIFVDSDDILVPSRIAAARSAMKYADVYACAMKIIDERGYDLGITFQKPEGSSIDTLIPRFNIFGMSNTCYTSEILKKCQPFPPNSVLLDWFVATRAWGNNATLVFDPSVQMMYRQHSLNTARVIPPFTKTQIKRSTELVLQHYVLVLEKITELPDSKRFLIENAQKYVEIFYHSVIQSPDMFEKYIRRLNDLPEHHIWWSCVAHPDLEDIWRK